jgi:hypothetical protein
MSVSLRNSTNCDYRSTIQADHKKPKTPKTQLFLFFLLQRRKLKSKDLEASSLLLFLPSTTTTTTLLPSFETIQQQQKNLSLVCLSVRLSVQPSLSPLCCTQQNSATYLMAQNSSQMHNWGGGGEEANSAIANDAKM